MPRIGRTTREQFPEELRYAWDRLAGQGAPPNIFAIMGNNPNLLLGYVRLGNALWNNCGLDLKTREMVILRCAYLQNSAYEWHQHVRIGRQAGLADSTINNLRSWRQADEFSESERALFALADSLAVSDHASDPVMNEMKKHFDDSTIVGAIILVAFYFATAKFLSSVEAPTEEPFVGWSL